VTNRMRRPLVAGNWKMHTTYEEAIQLAQGIAKGCIGLADVEVALIPPFPWIVALADVLHDSAIVVGAQTCSMYERGAYTGEVAAFMLAPFCRYVIVGHSERRSLFGETDEVVAAKLARILAHDMTPILCVGERLEEREAGETLGVIERQLQAIAASVDPSRAERLVVAYEPVWAIGTGRPATASDAQHVARFIREWVAERYGERAGQGVRILYGGSVTAENASAFFLERDIDGALVGGASLDAAQFCGIVEAAQAAAQAKKEV